MSSRRVSLLDLVHSRNSSPIPFTKPFISSPFPSSSSLNRNSNQDKDNRYHYTNRFNCDDNTSPDPLNCLSAHSLQNENLNIDPDPDPDKDPLNCISPPSIVPVLEPINQPYRRKRGRPKNQRRNNKKAAQITEKDQDHFKTPRPIVAGSDPIHEPLKGHRGRSKKQKSTDVQISHIVIDKHQDFTEDRDEDKSNNIERDRRGEHCLEEYIPTHQADRSTRYRLTPSELHKQPGRAYPTTRPVQIQYTTSSERSSTLPQTDHSEFTVPGSTGVSEATTPKLVQTCCLDSTPVTPRAPDQSSDSPIELPRIKDTTEKNSVACTSPIHLRSSVTPYRAISLEDSPKRRSSSPPVTPLISPSEGDLLPLALLAQAAFQQILPAPPCILPGNIDLKSDIRPPSATRSSSLITSKLGAPTLESHALKQNLSLLLDHSSLSSLSPVPTEINLSPFLLLPAIPRPSLHFIPAEFIENHGLAHADPRAEPDASIKSPLAVYNIKKPPDKTILSDSSAQDLDITPSSNHQILPDQSSVSVQHTQTKVIVGVKSVSPYICTTTERSAKHAIVSGSASTTTVPKSRNPTTRQPKIKLYIPRRHSTRIASRTAQDGARPVQTANSLVSVLIEPTSRQLTLPIKTSTNPQISNSVVADQTDNIKTNFKMASLPKREAKKPSRFQSPLESSASPPPPSAPTPPMESAPTPKDEGFSDSSLTPPPLSQGQITHSQRSPPAETAPRTILEEVPKKKRGRPSNAAIGKQVAEAATPSDDKDKVGRQGSEEGFPKKKRGRPSTKRLLSTSDQISSSATSTAEGSVSPTKIPKIKLSISKQPKQEAVPSNEKPEQDASTSLSIKKSVNTAGLGKKRKSEVVEAVSNVDNQEPVKKTKIVLKSVKTSSGSPAPPIKSLDEKVEINKKAKQTKGDAIEKPAVKSETQVKAKRPVRDYSSSSESEEEVVVKPKKKAQRIIEDDEEEERPKKKVQKLETTATVEGQDKLRSNGKEPPVISQTAIEEDTSVTKADKADDEGEDATRSSRSISPEKEKEKHLSKASSPKTLPKIIKKKPRPSELAEKAKGPETPINKSEGLVKSKAPVEEGSTKKTLPPKKAIPPGVKSAQAGTQASSPATKPSGHGMGLLGNTLALLQGTSTPKAKDPKIVERKEKKEIPKVNKRGGWTEEWILTPEQQREYDASAPQREAARKKREEWMKNPVNLQEAKDNYKVDSMQPRTIAVPGAMGIQTAGKPSQMVAALLGW
ncbi:uncharacterized protein I206_105395 [Kwoniella pini CBS 10737]|uniref:Uncharacterized protein n=1 Tax=Kwoniella pini CBS 10737 TaxID=1296096 RepID=A0AAJ8L6B2_9TREE